MTLYGIQLTYRYEEVGGNNTTVLRQLHPEEPDELKIKSIVADWMQKVKNQTGKQLFTINLSTVKSKVIDFVL